MITKALIFAAKAHEGQTRKGKKSVPYILHPMEAGTIAAAIKFDEEVISAAILHDVVEETSYTKTDIKDRFGERVAELVTADTEDKSKSWEERKQHTIDRLKNEKNEDVLIVVLADKLSNIRQMFKDYQAMGDKLWERFNRGKDKQRWYYTELIEGLKALDPLPEYKEYRELVKAVFSN